VDARVVDDEVDPTELGGDPRYDGLHCARIGDVKSDANHPGPVLSEQDRRLRRARTVEIGDGDGGTGLREPAGTGPRGASFGHGVLLDIAARTHRPRH
jgi:hypothetical protein